MPTVTYGGKQGEKVQLEVDPNLVAVRTRSRRSFRSGPVTGPEAAALQGMELVLNFPEAGVEVYNRPNRKARSVAQVKEALAPAPDTRFVGRVLVDENSGEPVLYTENLFVKFRDNVEEEAARRVLLDARPHRQGQARLRTQRVLRRSRPKASAKRSSRSPRGCSSATTSSTAIPS